MQMHMKKNYFFCKFLSEIVGFSLPTLGFRSGIEWFGSGVGGLLQGTRRGLTIGYL